MEKFSNYFYETFAGKINGKVRYHGDKDVEIIDINDTRIVKFYGLRKMVIYNKKVVTDFPKYSMNYLVSRIKN